MAVYRYTTECLRCEEETSFKTDALDGVIVWYKCERCDKICLSRIPGEYTGRKVRECTQRKQNAILDAFLSEATPQQTVRQIYYNLAVRGIVPKTNAGYRSVQYQLKTLRRDGVLPYGWIADNTRWQIRPNVYTGIESALTTWHDAYRRDFWARQGVHVEVWVEKDALAGVVSSVTREYAVPLYVARGFSSITFAYDAAQDIARIDKPTFVYHFGDFDPSGVSAAESLQGELARHGAQAVFTRAAVTSKQVAELELPTLPVNKKDSRAKKWPYNYVCELDAIPAGTLRGMVRDCIERHIDPVEWENTQQAERLERATLATMKYNFVQEQNNGRQRVLA